jgi:hypothetical protein
MNQSTKTKQSARKKPEPISSYLLLESERYWGLAAQAALTSLTDANDDQTDLARGHLLRASVWKEAATLVEKLEAV